MKIWTSFELLDLYCALYCCLYVLTRASPWMVGHDAGCLSRWIPTPVIHDLSANDQHALRWPELHLFNPDICLCRSQALEGDTSHYLWLAPVVEGSDHPCEWTTCEWTAFTGRTFWWFPCRDELFGLNWPCNVWIWPPGSARGRVLSQDRDTHIEWESCSKSSQRSFAGGFCPKCYGSSRDIQHVTANGYQNLWSSRSGIRTHEISPNLMLSLWPSIRVETRHLVAEHEDAEDPTSR